MTRFIHYRPLSTDRRVSNYIGPPDEDDEKTDDLSKVDCPDCLIIVMKFRSQAAQRVSLLSDTPVEVIKDKHLELGLTYEGY